MNHSASHVLNGFDRRSVFYREIFLARAEVFTLGFARVCSDQQLALPAGHSRIETLPCSFSSPRHRHLRAFATVVLAGSFEESGYVGRIRATAGDVLIHPAMDCHGNRMVSAGVKP